MDRDPVLWAKAFTEAYEQIQTDTTGIALVATGLLFACACLCAPVVAHLLRR